MSDDLPPVIREPVAPHTHTVIFLHGRGDQAKYFIKSLQQSRDSKNRSLPDAFPSFRWVCPRAPFVPVACNRNRRMHQWYDIWNTEDFSDNEDHQASGLRVNVPRIRTLLEEEAAVLGGRWDRIVLAGISQGAATGVHTLLNLNIPSPSIVDGQEGPCRLGAFMGFSCRLPFPGRSLVETRKILGLENVPDGDEVIRNTPILLEHCSDDPLVLIEGGRNLRDQLRGYGAQVVWKEYPDGAHWFHSPNGMDDAVEFLTTVLGIDDNQGMTKQGQVISDEMDLS